MLKFNIKFLKLFNLPMLFLFLVLRPAHAESDSSTLKFLNLLNSKRALPNKQIDIEKYLNSCQISKDPLLLKSSVIAGFNMHSSCGQNNNTSTIGSLSADINEVLQHAIYSGVSEFDTNARDMADLGKQAEYHALLQAGIARLKTLRVLRGINPSETEMKIEIGLLCSASYGKKACPKNVKNTLSKELKSHQLAINEAIALGLENSYTTETAKVELTQRLNKINKEWKKVWDISKKSGPRSLEAQLAYTNYIELYSIAVSDPIGVMIFNFPFSQLPKSLEDLEEEVHLPHEFRSKGNFQIRIRNSDVEKGFGMAISQSMRHIDRVTKCRNENLTTKPQLHCLLEVAPTAVGQALATNPGLATPGLCMVINKVEDDHERMQKNIGSIKTVTNFLDIASIPLLLVGGSGLLVKGLSSIISRSATATITKGLSASTKRLTLSSLSNGMLSTSGSVGIAASGARVSGGAYSAFIHGSNYLNYTASMQAAGKGISSNELERAIKVRNQTIESLQDLKDGSFDFLPFGALVYLARSEKIAKLTQSTIKITRFDKVLNGTSRLNRTLQLIKNRPGTKKAFQVAMKTSDLGASAVTNMIASISKMNTGMRNRIMDKLESIKDNDSAIIKFFRKINRKSSCL